MQKNKNLPTQEETKELEKLYKSNQLDELEKMAKKLITNYPKAFMLYNILGIVYQKKGKINDAISNFKQSINIKPNFAHAHNNLGNALKHVGEFTKSIESYKQAIKIEPSYAEAFSNFGIALKELGRLDESLKNLRKAIKLNPNYSEGYSNLGNTLSELGEYQDAVNNHKHALKLNPNYPEGYSNLGNCLGELGKFDEAISCHQKAIKLNPKYLHSIFNESTIRLTLGQFESGWNQYEYRFDRYGVGLLRYEKEKLWNGKYLDGVLLVWAEQGIGDHILFGSMLTEVRKFAKKIILEIDKRLIELFRRYFNSINFSNIEVVAMEKKLINNFDKHIAIGSLGKYFRKSEKSFESTPKKYLIASTARQKELKSKFFKNDKINIGISWKTLNKKQQFRNVNLEQLMPILSNPSLNFVNLQFGKTDEEIKKLNSEHGIHINTIDNIDNYNDIESLGALINCLDLVITIQNSTAHLAAALGKETWILLVKNARWHWTLLNKKKALWYPMAKLFRQEKFGYWNNVIDAVNIDLKKFQSAKKINKNEK